MRLFLVFFIGCWLAHDPLVAQTPNDNMVNAEHILFNQFINSQTHGNTVESHCVDERLTGKCIDYHNDQWYTFSTDSLTHLYINIFGQQCRDLRGVQLVVLSGELCDPTTYTILDCVSLATQDDIFVELKDLNPYQKYWINIDGYLEDYCSFFMEVSDQPRGFSIEPFPMPEISRSLIENVVTLEWSIPDSLAHEIKQTRIGFRDDAAFIFDSLAAIPVSFNAFGAMQNRYQFHDTLLLPGLYHYRIGLELTDGKKLFVDEFSFRVSGSSQSGVCKIPAPYERKTALRLQILDPDSHNLLQDLEITYQPNALGYFWFYTNQFKSKGIEALEVKVTDKYDRYTQTHYCWVE